MGRQFSKEKKENALVSVALFIVGSASAVDMSIGLGGLCGADNSGINGVAVGASISNGRIAGIITGLIGIAAMGLNYPIYTKIMKKSREKYSYEIIEPAKKVCGR